MLWFVTFLLLCSTPLSLLIHSLVNKHLVCFRLRVITIKATMNILYKSFCGYISFVLLDIYLGGKQPGHRMVGIYLTLLETMRKFSKILELFKRNVFQKECIRVSVAPTFGNISVWGFLVFNF